MDKAVLSVPQMWADHHVLPVREALLALKGVQEVYASAAWKTVVVNYNKDDVDEAALAQALAKAGYPVGEETDLQGQPLIYGDSAWHEMGVRVTETDERDLAMSGEFRRY